MTRDVDRANLLEAEVPLGVQDAGTARRIRLRPLIHVQGDVEAVPFTQLDEHVVDADDVVGVPGERGAQHGGDADGVLMRCGRTSSGPIVYLSGWSGTMRGSTSK